MTSSNFPDLRHLPDSEIPCVKISPANYKKKRTKPFIKGPIDLKWISAVSKVPGKAINVGLELIYLSGLNKSKKGLKLTNESYRRFNFSRPSAQKAIKLLEALNLIEVERNKGKKNRITIID